MSAGTSKVVVISSDEKGDGNGERGFNGNGKRSGGMIWNGVLLVMEGKFGNEGFADTCDKMQRIVVGKRWIRS